MFHVDVAYVAMAIYVCCKCIVLNILAISDVCCKCFYLDVAYVAAASYTHMLQAYVLNGSSVSDVSMLQQVLHVASVS